MKLSFKKNKLKIGIRSNKKLKNSFYYFIVDNKIDWAILLGSILCVLPYLASKEWYFIIIKSFILILLIIFSLKYLKTWNLLQDLDGKLEEARKKLKSGIDEEKLNSTHGFLDFQDELWEKLSLLINDYKAKTNSYRHFIEYLKYDKEVPTEVEGFLNEDVELTTSFVGFFFFVIIELSQLRVLPELKFKNYKRLILVFSLTLVFFLVYAIENSI